MPQQPRRVAEQLMPSERPVLQKRRSPSEDVSQMETRRMSGASAKSLEARARPVPAVVPPQRMYEEEDPVEATYTGQIIVEEIMPVHSTWSVCFYLFLFGIISSVIWPLDYLVRHLHWFPFH